MNFTTALTVPVPSPSRPQMTGTRLGIALDSGGIHGITSKFFQ